MPKRGRGPKRLLRPLAAILLVAFSLRLAVTLSLRTLGIDEELMYSSGEELFQTGEYRGISWPIVWPVLCALLSRAVGVVVATKSIYVVLGTLLVVPMYLATRRLSNESVGRWTALMVAVLPATCALISKSGSHSVYLPLLALGFWTHARILERPRPEAFLLLGAVLGFAYVTRSDGIVYLGAVGASFLCHGPQWRERWKRVALVALGGAIFIVPNVVHIRHQTGKWALSAHVSKMLKKPFYLKEPPAFVADAAHGDQPGDNGDTASESEKGFGAYIHALAVKTAYNVRLFLGHLGDIYVLPVPLLLLIGFALAGRSTNSRRLEWMVLLWCVPPLAFLALNVEARYLSPMALFAMPLVGLGLAEVTTRKRIVGVVVGLLVVLFLIGCNLMTTLSLRALEPSHERTLDY